MVAASPPHQSHHLLCGHAWVQDHRNAAQNHFCVSSLTSVDHPCGGTGGTESRAGGGWKGSSQFSGADRELSTSSAAKKHSFCEMGKDARE